MARRVLVLCAALSVLILLDLHLAAVADSPVDCGFDSGLCGYTQLQSDDFNWTRHRDLTASPGSGPDADHTSGSGYYMYTEATGRYHGDKAVLVSPTLTWSPPSTLTCLAFWYSMVGRDIGILSLEVVPVGGDGSPHSQTLWTQEGSQEAGWHEAKMTVNTLSPVEFRWTGTIGAGFKGDMAIDDVTATRGRCEGSENTYSCDFESNTTCAWREAKGSASWLSWELATGSSASSENASSENVSASAAGPTTDHTTRNHAGHYIYVTHSQHGSVQPHASAMLVSPEVNGTTTSFGCLRFWYNPSSGQGQLAVHVVDNATMDGRRVWAVDGTHGNQGDAWLPAVIPICYLETFVIVIEGSITGDNSSGLAMDDISYDVNTYCPLTPDNAETSSGLFHFSLWPPDTALTTVTPAIVTTHPVDPSLFFSCDFETDCGFSNITGNFSWTLHSGSTPSVGTGPKGDHTPGRYGQGQYMYIEATSLVGQTALTATEEFPASPSGFCVKFYYHMYGRGMGTLNVKLEEGGSLLTRVLWTKAGNQGDQWRLAQVDVPNELTTQPFKVVFEGILLNHGRPFLGEMAVDDVQTLPASCLEGDSSFEVMSTWDNVPSNKVHRPAGLSNDTADWAVGSHSTHHGGAPRDDHTFNNNRGVPHIVTTTPIATTATPTIAAPTCTVVTSATPTTSTTATATTPTTTTPTIATTTPTTTTTTPTTTTTTPTTSTIPTTTTTTSTTSTTPTTTTTTPTSTTTPTTTTTTPTTSTIPTTTTTTPTTTVTTPTTSTTTPTTTTATPSTPTNTPTTSVTTSTLSNAEAPSTPKTTVTSASAVSENPNRCQVCRDIQCFTGPQVVTCPPQQPLCSSRITDTSGSMGGRAVVKGCVSRSQCDAWTPSDNDLRFCPKVDRLVSGRDIDCLYCCHGDLCNKGPAYIPARETWVGKNQQGLDS